MAITKTIIPVLQGDQYTPNGKTDPNQFATDHPQYDIDEYGYFDVLEPGGGGSGSGYGGWGNDGGGNADFNPDNAGGGVDPYKDPTLDDEIERYWEELQASGSDEETKKSNWLLYGALAIGLFSIIK